MTLDKLVNVNRQNIRRTMRVRLLLSLIMKLLIKMKEKVQQGQIFTHIIYYFNIRVMFDLDNFRTLDES